MLDIRECRERRKSLEENVEEVRIPYKHARFRKQIRSYALVIK